MNLISDSQDVLFLALALCALWLTAFFAWFLYYAIMSVRQIYQAVKQIKSKIDAVDEIITMIREKISASTSYLTLIVAGVRKVVDLLGSDKSEKKKKARN